MSTGPYSVYYDFILFSGQFTMPNAISSLDFSPSYAHLPIPGRIVDVTQALGSQSATCQMTCDLTLGIWKRSGDVVDGQVFYEIAHSSQRWSEPWQWLDTGFEAFKVVLSNPVVRHDGDRTVMDLKFREYRLNPPSSESYIERFGLNL